MHFVAIADKQHKRMMKSMIKTYSDLKRLDTFDERLRYLKLDGTVGSETFGFERYLNQAFYRSDEWKQIRNQIIIRDKGCDLGIDGCEMYGNIIVHHINPIITDDIINQTDLLLNPEYLISTTLQTHNAIHYGNVNLVTDLLNERSKNDMCPWRQ